eukprot:1612052-Prymnesium_polylepis.1
MQHCAGWRRQPSSSFPSRLRPTMVSFDSSRKASTRKAFLFDTASVPRFAAGTVCFTPYFHVMGYVANLCFNLVAGIRSAVLASTEAKLNPQLLLSACKSLKPTVLNTVPWVVEGFVDALESKQGNASSILASLQMLTYGGAALAPHCPGVLRKHGIT